MAWQFITAERRAGECVSCKQSANGVKEAKSRILSCTWWAWRGRGRSRAGRRATAGNATGDYDRERPNRRSLGTAEAIQTVLGHDRSGRTTASAAFAASKRPATTVASTSTWRCSRTSRLCGSGTPTSTSTTASSRAWRSTLWRREGNALREVDWNVQFLGYLDPGAPKGLSIDYSRACLAVGFRIMRAGAWAYAQTRGPADFRVGFRRRDGAGSNRDRRAFKWRCSRNSATRRSREAPSSAAQYLEWKRRKVGAYGFRVGKYGDKDLSRNDCLAA